MTSFNISFKRMYPEDFVEITGRMPHDSFIGSEETRKYYENIVRKHPLNNPQKDTYAVKESAQIAKKEIKSANKSVLKKIASFFKL